MKRNAYKQKISRDYILQRIGMLSFALTIASAVLSGWVLTSKKNFSATIDGTPAQLIYHAFIFIYLLDLLLKFAQEALMALFTHRIGIILGKYFLRRLLDPAQLAYNHNMNEPAEKYLETMCIGKDSLVSFYTDVVCRIPQGLLYPLSIVFQIYINYASTFAIILVVSILALYFTAFLGFIIVRSQIRPKINRQAIAKAEHMGTIYNRIEYIKIWKAENEEAEVLYKKSARYYFLTTTYLVVSEYFRMIMRVILYVARFVLLELAHCNIGLVEPAEIFGWCLWMNKLDESLLLLRNSLAMLFEYKAEADFIGREKSIVTDPARALAPPKDYQLILKSRRAATYREELRSPLAIDRSCSQPHILHPSYTIELRDVEELDEPYEVPAYNSNELGAESDLHTASQDKCAGLLYIPRAIIRPRVVNYIACPCNQDAHVLAEMIIGMRLYKGMVLFNNRCASLFTEKERFSMISYLPPFQELFNKSIMFNITYGTGLTDAQAVERIKWLGLSGVFKSFNEGFDSYVGVGGGTLSAGQRQLVCLARALLKDCPIYLLCSPYTHLAPDWIKKCKCAIEQMRSKTIIIFELTQEAQ